jgi:SAM-dependent methyltransferase
MDRLKFFELSRRYHLIDNPISVPKLERVIDVLNLTAGARVLDVASGKGELLARIAEKYRAHCTGIEHNPAFCAEANARARGRGLSALVEVREQRGQDFRADDGSYDAAMCVGAEWIFGGWHGTLAQLAQWTRKSGSIVAGTPFWSTTPSPDYLALSGISEGSFSTHSGNVAVGESLGLTLLYTVTSDQDDWDHYCGLTWLAAYDHIRDHPDDPDNPEIAALTRKDQESYFGGGRQFLGWGIYVFRKAA